ncbi:MAG TPA: hypothetical protein VNO32_42765 [Candidatus Acidoferrum sp.]|nr:hypothetical protein [Candidatus Acidoferrum sp.]
MVFRVWSKILCDFTRGTLPYLSFLSSAVPTPITNASVYDAAFFLRDPVFEQMNIGLPEAATGELLKAGVDIRKVSKFLGHARVSSGGAVVLSLYSIVVETARSGTHLRRTFFGLVIQG